MEGQPLGPDGIWRIKYFRHVDLGEEKKTPLARQSVNSMKGGTGVGVYGMDVIAEQEV